MCSPQTCFEVLRLAFGDRHVYQDLGRMAKRHFSGSGSRATPVVRRSAQLATLVAGPECSLTDLGRRTPGPGTEAKTSVSGQATASGRSEAEHGLVVAVRSTPRGSGGRLQGDLDTESFERADVVALLTL